MKTIAVFGSSVVEAGHEHYEASYQVGHSLAQAGYVVATGGYSGVMEAASKGAAEAGGHVIGVTTETIARLRGAVVNPWVHEEIQYETLRERMMHLVRESDGYVVMPGGVGTMSELVACWELLHANELPRRPLLLYGDYWLKYLAPMRDNPYFRPAYWSLLQVAQSGNEIVEQLSRWKVQ